MRPKDYLPEVDGHLQAVPADIPRVRYELLARRVRTGNGAPVADAGPDQIGVAAGTITLNGSGSFDPEGDPITFQWTQVAGPAVARSAGRTRRSQPSPPLPGQVYAFRLTVKDDHGAQGIARTSITTSTPQLAKIVRFQSSPSSIKPGQSSTLDWQVFGADTVTISELGTVPLNGSKSGYAHADDNLHANRPQQRRRLDGERHRGGLGPAGPVHHRVPGAADQHHPRRNGDDLLVNAEHQFRDHRSGNRQRSGHRVAQQVTPTETTTYTITALGRQQRPVELHGHGKGQQQRQARRGSSTSRPARRRSIPGEPTTTPGWLTTPTRFRSRRSAPSVCPAAKGDGASPRTRRTPSPRRTNTAARRLRCASPSGNRTLTNCQASPSAIAKPGDPAELMWSMSSTRTGSRYPLLGAAAVSECSAHGPSDHYHYL